MMRCVRWNSFARAEWRGSTRVSPAGSKMPRSSKAPTPVIERTREWLSSYFDGESADISGLRLEMRGAPFELRVWDALREDSRRDDDDLRRDRARDRIAGRVARRGHGERRQPDRDHRSVPSRDRIERHAHRLRRRAGNEVVAARSRAAMGHGNRRCSRLRALGLGLGFGLWTRSQPSRGSPRASGPGLPGYALKIRSQLSEGLPPMADRRLAIAGFGQRAAKRRVIEDRVVAEAAGAARLGGNEPVDRPARFEHEAIAVATASAHTKRAVRSASGTRPKLFFDQRELLRVRSSSPPNRAECTPGAPPSASISRPESSATVSDSGVHWHRSAPSGRRSRRTWRRSRRATRSPGSRRASGCQSAGRPAAEKFRPACRDSSWRRGVSLDTGRTQGSARKIRPNHAP